MKQQFSDIIGNHRVYWDGGTGSLLQAQGLKGGELPERWNLIRPEIVTDVAYEYLMAGSHIINANTFGANALHYPDRDELMRIIEAGVLHVREAIRRSGRSDAFVSLDIGPTGRLLKPFGDLEFEKAVGIFSEVVRCGRDAGADLILIETMNDSLEAKAAVLAAKENADLPVCVTMVYDERGKLLTGGTPEGVAAMLEGLKVDALGVNCGMGPAGMMPVVRRLKEFCSVPLIVNPNAGLPRSENGRTVYDLTCAEFAEEMREVAMLGIQILGGCCGTTPEYIRHLIGATQDIPFSSPVKKRKTVVSSCIRMTDFSDRPVIIGERINPTGKKRFKEALRAGDLDYIVQQGISQEESGADLLDVNVGLPEIDEPAMMVEAVTRLQSVIPLPLQIDTTDPCALEKALRIYNGKAMINSVSGKEESLSAVLPLAAKYGGVVVGLPIDENGIPDTVEGRLAVARRIIQRAEEYGIGREDLVIDGLAMTISTDTCSATVTLDTIAALKEQLQVATILGVSNISFGLPQREIINSSFFTMALMKGLSSAIINPGSDAMMAAYRAYLALSGKDPVCGAFILTYGNIKGKLCIGGAVSDAGSTGPAESAAERVQKSGTPSDGMEELAGKIEFGLGDKAAEAARILLQSGTDPLDIVDKGIIPALDTVGKGFEKGTVFLPQLLMSAEAAKAAFDVIKSSMSGNAGNEKGTVVLATVKGDIHDIGKNIVKVLLENYGYRVIDLGKDVDPETIVSTAVEEDIHLVGLSALMTTTVVSMEETIRILREKKPDTKVVVGGAVMTQEYADAIGADHYSKEAMDTVRYADSLFVPGT